MKIQKQEQNYIVEKVVTFWNEKVTTFFNALMVFPKKLRGQARLRMNDEMLTNYLSAFYVQMAQAVAESCPKKNWSMDDIDENTPEEEIELPESQEDQYEQACIGRNFASRAMKKAFVQLMVEKLGKSEFEVELLIDPMKRQLSKDPSTKGEKGALKAKRI